MLSELTHSPSYLETAKYYKKSERQNMTLASVMTVLMKTAWMDRTLNNLEQRYLIRESKNWCDLEEQTRKKLLDIHSTLVRRNVNFSKFIPAHISYLETQLALDEKIKLIQAAAIICRSDLEIAPSEQMWMEKLGTLLKVPARNISEILMNAKFIADSRRKEAESECQINELPAHDDYKLPEIKLDFE